MKVTIEIPQGSDLTVQVSKLGDITGATGYFAVRTEAGEVVIEKSTATPEEGAVVSESTGKVEFYVVPDDTAELTVGAKYYYDAWIETAGGKRYQVREISKFTILDRVVVFE